MRALARIAWLVLAALAGSQSAADPWPVSEFEVFEGVPWGSTNAIETKAGRALGAFGPEFRTSASVPLSPALRNAIESYLHQVAQQMEAAGFAAPYLEPVLTRDDGKPAFRIYYYDFQQAGAPATTESSLPARYAYGCEDEAGHRRIIHLNAARLTAPGTGGATLTDKAYVDLAHELFHAVQRGSAFYKTNCDPPAWMTEGQAEAYAQDLAWKLRKTRQADHQVARWGMRAYFDPIAVTSGPSAREQAYQSSSLWRYLAELAHAHANTDPARRLPGPGAGGADYDVDYRYLARLLGDGRKLSGRDGALNVLNKRLLTEPAFNTPLAGIYPNFVATLAAYGRYRVSGRKSLDERYDAWIENTLGPCWQGAPTPFSTGFVIEPLAQSANVRRVLGPVTARCVRVRIGAIVMPTTLDVRAQVASKEVGQQLYLGVAGGEIVAAAVVGERSGGDAVASWSLAVKPGDVFDLVIANVARVPADTVEADLQLHVSLAGWALADQGSAQAPGAQQKAPTRKARPAPAAGTTQTQGNGTTAAERDEDVPDKGCGWPASDFNAYCGPWLKIALRSVPGAIARTPSMSTTGGFMNQLLGSASVLFGEDGNAGGLPGPTEYDGLSVQLAVPLPAYGETRSYNTAMITVEGGGWPRSGAYARKDRMAGTQTYFPPNGRVVIETYTPLELRGHFEADLVALPLPDADRQSLPSLPLLRTLSGSFLVTRPWEGEADYTVVKPDTSTLGKDLADRMPGPPGDSADPANAANESRSSPTGISVASGVAACDCSCAGYRRLTQVLAEMDEQPDAMPSTSQLGSVMCMMNCSASYDACEVD